MWPNPQETADLVTFTEEMLIGNLQFLCSEKILYGTWYGTIINIFTKLTLREKCPYSEFFWSVFSRILTEYGEILRICPYSVQMRENMEQNNPNTDTFCAVLTWKKYVRKCWFAEPFLKWKF